MLVQLFMAGSVILTDGTLDSSLGINSNVVTTVQSERNPNGLPRNQLAWGDNLTVRDGGIHPRGGWLLIKKQVADSSAFFQGMTIYSPLGDTPYIIYSISGRILKQDIEGGPIVDLSAIFGLTNPSGDFIAQFQQANKYLIIQAGDNTTLPLFWDGAILRRSVGFISVNNTPLGGVLPYNEIPAAGAMDYFMGRVFYAQGRVVNAGDIVGGNSGTLANEFQDSVLKVTECPLVLGGDGFTVPAQDGIVTGLAHSANLDASLGQGRLFMGTNRGVYALNVPVTRADWIATTNSTQPLVTVVQINNGWVNDRGIVAVNGDLFYQSLEPAIRSLNQSIRYFGQWANRQISNNEQRILQYNDRALLKYCSGANFDNRLLMSALPVRVDQGVVHRALIPLDFEPISSFGQDVAPNWEGMYEGIGWFQIVSGDFDGRERCFGTALDPDTNDLQLWEITKDSRFDLNAFGDSRITWLMEFPAFTFGDETMLKKLVGAELWIDRLYGTSEFTLEYRPDGQACWLQWFTWKECTPKFVGGESDLIGYLAKPCQESYRNSMSMPFPPVTCTAMQRPSNQAFQFQTRLIIKGFCRIRGIYLHAEPLDRKLYLGLVC